MSAVRLRHVVRVNPPSLRFERLPDDAEVTFLPMEAVWPGNRLDRSEERMKASVSTGYTRFEDGDVLVPKITPTFEASRSVLIDGLLNGVGTGTTELHVLRPSSDIDARYLLYTTHSHPFLKLGEAEMYGVAGQKRVPDTFIRNYHVGLPPLPEQRRIANFLDAETTRIGALEWRRRSHLSLHAKREYSVISEVLISQTAPNVRLGYISRLQSGLTIDGSRQLGASTVTRPYLRVANVQSGHLDLTEVKEVAVPASIAARCSLRPGDVLMTEGGDLDKLGRGTVWHGELPDCLHQNHVFSVRPEPNRLDAEYLALLTRSAHGRTYFESTGTKTTNLASTSSSKILDFPVPLSNIDEQRALVHRVNISLENSKRIQSSIERQLRLLAERKQALITAAVTGQIDVSTAHGLRD